MKKLILLLALLVPMVSHGACQCDEEDEPDEDAPYQQYDYLGIKSGVGRYQNPTRVDDAKSDGAFFGHRYSKLFGGELEYTFLGRYTGVTSTGNVVAFSASGVHFYDITETLALTGKLGIASARTISSLIGGAPGNNQGSARLNLTYGVGVEWRISKNWNLRGEYDSYKANMPTAQSITNTYVAIAYRF